MLAVVEGVLSYDDQAARARSRRGTAGRGSKAMTIGRLIRLSLAGVVAAGAAMAQGSAQPPTDTTSAAATQATKSTSKAAPAKGGTSASPEKRSTRGMRYEPDRFAGRDGTYYRMVWGVDGLVVKWAESGEVIRFSYHVLDADKAKLLGDKKLEPSLVDPQRGVKLVVPSLENVGQLRQSAPPENGKAYWMVFSNKGRLVKRGDHVNVVIGAFHADGLVVD